MADTLESDPRPLGLARVLSIQAHANRLANRRLQAALAGLSTSDLHARRISFFPTLIGTLNLPGADGTIFLIMTVKSVDL